MKTVKFFLLLVISLQSILLFSQSSLIISDEAIDAHEMYWSAFTKYQKKIFAESQKKYEKMQEEYGKEHKIKDDEERKASLKDVNEAKEHYSKLLLDLVHSQDKAYVLYNLAVVEYLLFELTDKNEMTSKKAGQNAISLLEDLQREFENFSHIDEALYLQGILYTALNNKEKAMSVWGKLDKRKQISVYSTYAGVALGDSLFAMEKPEEAFKVYERSLLRFMQLRDKKNEYILSEIEYRLAWTAYRSGNFLKLLQYGPSIVNDSYMIVNPIERAKSVADFAIILADALFEKQDLEYSLKFLNHIDDDDNRAQIAIKLAENYERIHNLKSALAIIEKIEEGQNYYSHHYELLRVKSAIFGAQNNPDKQIAALEELAYLASPESLFRGKFSKEYNVIEKMQEFALAAAKRAAHLSFEQGRATGNKKYFKRAAQNFAILIELDKSNKREWLYQQALSHDLAEDYSEAIKYYKDIIADAGSDEKVRKLARQQSVMVEKKKWQNLLQKTSDFSGSGKDNSAEISRGVDTLSQAILEYVENYSSDSQSIDFLLLLGEAYKNTKQYALADDYWRRALLLAKDSRRRQIAIHGLTYSALNSESKIEAIRTILDIIKTEAWNRENNGLRQELEQILVNLSFAESSRLSHEGQLKNSAYILLVVANELANKKPVEKMLRDAGLSFALCGEWGKVQIIGERFINEFSRSVFLPDALYFLSKAYEYQFQFTLARDTYFRLGEKYPKHSKAKASMENALRLAYDNSENEFAGKIAWIMANRVKNMEEKLNYLQVAYEHFFKVEKFETCSEIAQKAIALLETQAEILTWRLAYVRSIIELEYTREAVVQLTSILKVLDAKSKLLSKESESGIRTNANWLLGDLKRRELDKNFEENISYSDLFAIYNDAKKYWSTCFYNNASELALRCRFELAKLSSDLADKVKSTLYRDKDTVSGNEARKREHEVQELRNYAILLHNDNLLKSNSYDAEARKWVLRSANRLGNSMEKELIISEILPNDIEFSLPEFGSL